MLMAPAFSFRMKAAYGPAQATSTPAVNCGLLSSLREKLRHLVDAGGGRAAPDHEAAVGQARMVPVSAPRC
jgi:hypothetical protein